MSQFQPTDVQEANVEGAEGEHKHGNDANEERQQPERRRREKESPLACDEHGLCCEEEHHLEGKRCKLVATELKPVFCHVVKCCMSEHDKQKKKN